jgi:hypothetical protein
MGVKLVSCTVFHSKIYIIMFVKIFHPSFATNHSKRGLEGGYKS